MTAKLDAPLELTTERLLLRQPRLADARPLYEAYAADPEVVRYVTWRAHDSEADTRAFLEYARKEWAEGHSYPYVIAARERPEAPFGMIHPRSRPHGVEFGYVLAKAEWGKGTMTEALKALVDWSLAQPEVWRAQAFCDVENVASARVMEKAGMSFEGLLRGYSVHPNRALEPRDCKLYAKVRG